MKHRMPLACTVCAALLTLTGCVDDKYDLSDIDTTSRIEVNDLTIPVNIDPFTLESMFDLDEEDPDEKIKVIDGVYCVTEKGSFTSSEIIIDRINLGAVPGTASSDQINTGVSGNLPANQTVAITFSTGEASVSYSTTDVPDEIKAIKSLKADFDISYTLVLKELVNKVSKLKFDAIDVQFPAGLTGVPSVGSYNGDTGILHIPAADASKPSLDVTLHCSAIDFKKIGGEFDPDTHTAKIDLKVRIIAGGLSFNSSDLTGAMPATVTLEGESTITAMTVNAFSGRIEYNIEGVNIDPVVLNDLPDLLQQKETKINILNPQIYLNVENPLSSYKLEATTGFVINSEFTADDGEVILTTTHELDNPGFFTVSSASSSDYCLSPKEPTPWAAGYTPGLHVPYTSLSSVLEGNGLPARLNIALKSPKVFNQPVDDLHLGVGLGEVTGHYDFLAPLALGEKSQVVYTKLCDGWNDEDVDAITIETLIVKTKVTSHVPFDLTFTGYPVDVNGNQINGVKIEGADVPAGSVDKEVTIRITGKVTHLDGINFTATGFVPADMKAPLAPEQAIDCADIRANVSGYYIKKF